MNKTYMVFKNNGLNLGRIISSSKSMYMSYFPENVVIFNANIFTKTLGKIWYGDLDINKDLTNLQEVSKKIGEDLLILNESDGRRGNGATPFTQESIKNKVRITIKCK